MSNFQPMVLKTNTDRYGKKVTSIDRTATEKKLQTWLKRKKIVRPIYINSWKADKKVVEDTDYAIAVSVVDGYYSSNSRQFRVYVKEGYAQKRFVQSSKEGVLNMEKLLALVVEITESENRRYNHEWESAHVQKNFETRMKECNKALKGTGFRLENNYHGSFKIESEGGGRFWAADLDEVVAKLLTLKK